MVEQMVRKLKHKEQQIVDIFNDNKTNTICLVIILHTFYRRFPESYIANRLGLPGPLSYLEPPTYTESVHYNHAENTRNL